MPTENLWRPDCIRTVSGQYVNVLEPDPNTIVIEDIAHALSNMPRFGAHLPIFYSVAQHSLQVVTEVMQAQGSPSVCLQALLHDASEAYLIDVPTPVKLLLGETYYNLEANLNRVIMEKYDLPDELHNLVQVADRKRLEWEWENLMLGNIAINKVFAERPWEVKTNFLILFNSLYTDHQMDQTAGLHSAPQTNQR